MKTVLMLMAVTTLTSASAHPLTREQAIGRQIENQLRRESTPLVLPEVQAWLENIGRQIGAGFGSALTWSFELTTDTAKKEAVAAPSGAIFVPAGAILASENEQTFIRALAHQMAHTANPNSIRPARPSTSGSIPLIFMGGWTGHGSQELLVPKALTAYVEQLEREADDLAAQALATAGEITSGRFAQMQELVRGTTQHSRRPPTLYRK